MPNNQTSPKPDMLTFLASSVHDMKNSVSMLIGGLQSVLSSLEEANSPAFADLTQMTYEAKRINNNLVQLLTLYKLGENIYPFDPQQIAMPDFLTVIAEQASGMLKHRRITLEIDCPPDTYGYFDEDLVTSVIGNAFSNAVRYTRSRVALSARLGDNDLLEIRIDDDGRGYPTEMIEQLSSALPIDVQSGSTGLGLYFSTAIARLHQNHGRVGEIRLENGGRLGGGTFIVRLP